MKQTDLLNMGKEAFFNALSRPTKLKLIDAWKRTIDPNDNNDENETLCEIFVAATHILPNTLEICTPLHNTDSDVDFFKITFERQTEVTNIDAEEIAELLIRAYNTIFETGEFIKERVAPLKDGAISLYPFTIQLI